MKDAPDITVIVEWENVLLSGKERSERMLSRLSEQACALGRPLEVIVVCNPADADPSGLRSLLEDRLGAADGAPIPWRLVSAPGAHYYELKNRGAAEARGPVVVLLDSDVVPDAGWLAGMVEPFADPAVAVVAGNTYVEPRSLYSRAFALGWFFPRRSQTPGLRDGARYFWANNLAFRRELLIQNPFPRPADGSTRGACADLAASLRGQGICLWQSTAAQVSHPPPRGLGHFIARAVADGRDRVLHWRGAGKSRWGLPFRSIRHCVKETLRVFGATLRHRREVSLRLVLVPAAWGIMGTYQGFSCLGAIATTVAPAPMSRGFRI
jgi:hypothetical protein